MSSATDAHDAFARSAVTSPSKTMGRHLSAEQARALGRKSNLVGAAGPAVHGLLFANRRVNDWLGTWLCAYPVFTSLALYRPYHLQHHRFMQQAEDPAGACCKRIARCLRPA